MTWRGALFSICSLFNVCLELGSPVSCSQSVGEIDVQYPLENSSEHSWENESKKAENLSLWNMTIVLTLLPRKAPQEWGSPHRTWEPALRQPSFVLGNLSHFFLLFLWLILFNKSILLILENLEYRGKKDRDKKSF